MRAQTCGNESERLAALRDYGILDTPREEAFDDLTRLACRLFDTPIAVVNLIDSGRQWFKSEVGLGVRETPLETSICAHAILQDEMLVVPDTRLDPRFADNPLVHSDPHLQFYAGALLKTPEGHALGTLCILDNKPRAFGEAQRETLRVLGQQVMAQIETRKLLRESLAANAALRVIDRRKDEFLATLAHELRNPLSAIAAALSILEAPQTTPDMSHRARATLGRQARQMQRLVDDLVDSSRLTQGKVSLRIEPVELAQLVDRVVEACAPAIERRRQRLSVAMPPGPVVLRGDLVRLSQLFSNLLSNASRYTPDEGRIAFAGRVLDGTVELTVSDDGAGIAAQDVERIFELFTQASVAKEASDGLGIGLTLARSIAQMHGGTIEARSEGLGRGSSFVTRIPQ